MQEVRHLSICQPLLHWGPWPRTPGRLHVPLKLCCSDFQGHRDDSAINNTDSASAGVGWALESVFLTYSQVMPTLLTCWPHFEQSLKWSSYPSLSLPGNHPILTQHPPHSAHSPQPLSCCLAHQSRPSGCSLLLTFPYTGYQTVKAKLESVTTPRDDVLLTRVLITENAWCTDAQGNRPYNFSYTLSHVTD